VRLSDEVAEALSAGRPVVALETSVVAQGLPAPQNLETARACEQAVREAGAVPATTAVLDGVLRAGLFPHELERLADPAGREGLLKVAARDLGLSTALGRSGGTTVSASVAIAAAAGIRVFTTGGIGGVHRGAAEHFDLSQDLLALSRHEVAVVCAGAKSVLDLPKTLEALEALAVPVVGVGTSELPAFYSQGSGLMLEHRVEDAAAAARVVGAHLAGPMPTGLVFALPPPAATALPRDEVEALLEAALRRAEAQGVRGTKVTPFLLAELAKASGGRTLAANLALLVHNARFAGKLAAALVTACPRW
jgi:pseudouridine-5'-phosphate glycosidase